MRVGGLRTLLIPPQLGYGGRRVGNVVPPHASLVFDIELVSTHCTSPHGNAVGPSRGSPAGQYSRITSDRCVAHG